jgi:hypothetical protein
VTKEEKYAPDKRAKVCRAPAVGEDIQLEEGLEGQHEVGMMFEARFEL